MAKLQVIRLALIQNELPESLSSIARFAGNTDKVFSSITDLIHGSFEEEKIHSTIRSLTRPAFENLAVLVNKVRSLFIALYNINHATMDEKKMLRKCEQHSLEALKCVINPETGKILNERIKIKLQESETFGINEILDFLGMGGL